MKATAFLLFASLIGAASGAQQAYPDPIPEAKYEKLKTGWPFVLAKAPEPVQEEKVSWAQGLWLSSVAVHRTADGGEQPWVSIRSQQDPTSFVALTLNEEKDGMVLVKVENLDDPKKTTATVKKNNEFATLKRDESNWNSPAPPPQGAPRPGNNVRVPGQPAGIPVPNAQGAIRPPGAQPTPANGAPRGPAIPRPPTSAIPPPTNIPAPAVQPGAAPAGQPDARKRIRVINSGR